MTFSAPLRSGSLLFEIAGGRASGKQFPPPLLPSPSRMRSRVRLHHVVLLCAPLAACAARQPAETTSAPSPSSTTADAAAPAELPLKLAPRPTEAAITAADLMTRLYVYADDSMLGREAGAIGGVKATDYIAAEARRIGLEPAGESGTYFQIVPMAPRSLDTAATSLAIAGGSSAPAPLTLWADYVPVGGGPLGDFASARRLDGVQVVYGGRLGDASPAISPAQAAGKLVLLAPPPAGTAGAPGWQFWTRLDLSRWKGAAGVAVATLDASPPGLVGFLQSPHTGLQQRSDTAASTPAGLIVTSAVANRLLGAPLESAKPGALGRTLRGAVRFVFAPTPTPARNVVAILRGSDPVLRNEYVAIGAHNDHVGVAKRAVDHDSLRAFSAVMRPEGAESEVTAPPTPDQRARIAAILDSLRRIHPVARMDSVFNGADDDGSGTVSVLEIAQAMAAAPTKPRRSILFVWHTAEEKGLFGARHFTESPTVPRDSIVAQLNIDMIGRGKASDVPNGGPSYLQLIGSRRLSTELGDLVEAVNTRSNLGFAFDYQYDADGHPANYYCRSDHYEYARFGIPIVFFSTGGHQDYHMLTDEPQYIDYPHMARVATLVRDIALDVANLDHHVVVDKPKPDPYGSCQQ